jgi:hypothetical protein
VPQYRTSLTSCFCVLAFFPVQIDDQGESPSILSSGSQFDMQPYGPGEHCLPEFQ